MQTPLTMINGKWTMISNPFAPNETYINAHEYDNGRGYYNGVWYQINYV